MSSLIFGNDKRRINEVALDTSQEIMRDKFKKYHFDTSSSAFMPSAVVPGCDPLTLH